MKRRLLLAVAISQALVLASGAPAEAAPIRECGEAHLGALTIHNVTTRAVSCYSGRRFARRYVAHGSPACQEDRYCTHRGWRCTNVGRTLGGGLYEIDTRCVKQARVVHWQVRGA
jgi:hypothetical protein